jgi:restriction endonuclease S subunit
MSVELNIGTLPIDWMNSSLGKHIEIIMGQAPPGADCNKEGVGTPFVKVGEFGQDRPLIREWTTKPLRMAKESDVLFCVVGATCGKVNRGADCAIGRSVAALRPLGTINRDFLFHFMFSKMMEMRASSRGSAQGVISKTDLNELLIPIPNLSEQEKIVEILEEQISRLDAALASVRAVREKAARFRRSLLHAAFTGALTGHDISTGGHPEGWMIKDLRELVDVLDSMRKPINSEERLDRTGTVPYFGASGQVGTIDKALFDEDLVLLGEDGVQFFDVDKHKAYEISGPSWVNNHAHVLRCKKEKYIQHLLVCYLNQFDYRNYANGTTRLKLTQAAMNRIPVIVPPLKEQEKIVGILEEQLARLDSSLAIADAIERKSSAMRRALLHAAFTGELTKEWREGAHV